MELTDYSFFLSVFLSFLVVLATFIYFLQQQILWSAEKHADDGYWHQKNLDQCVIDVMGDFIETLKQGQLPHFFKPTVNILEHKRQDVLRIIMKYFENERSKLLRME